MYCTKCGKEIEAGTVCRECMEAESGVNANAGYHQPEQPTYAQPVQPIQPTYGYGNSYQPYAPSLPEPGNRMYGFGKALASTIISYIGFIFVYVALILSTMEYEGGVGLVMAIISLPLIIIPLIMGIKSIGVFNQRKATCAKPIATLILGINGLAMAACSALMDFILMVVALMLL